MAKIETRPFFYKSEKSRVTLNQGYYNIVQIKKKLEFFKTRLKKNQRKHIEIIIQLTQIKLMKKN